MKRPDIVQVEWVDAWHDFENADPDEKLEPETCHTLGYLIRKDKRGITLAMDTGKTDDGWESRFRQFIPAGMVKRVRRIQWPTR